MDPRRTVGYLNSVSADLKVHFIKGLMAEVNELNIPNGMEEKVDDERVI